MHSVQYILNETMGANGQRNDGSIRPAEWRNQTRSSSTTDSVTSTEHCMQTLWNLQHSKKNLIIYIKYIVIFLWKINKFGWKNLHLIVGTTQYCDTQQTIHNTTNNTQHKIHSCYIISFEKCFGHFWRGGLFELDWFRDRRQLNSLLTATEDGC